MRERNESRPKTGSGSSDPHPLLTFFVIVKVRRTPGHLSVSNPDLTPVAVVAHKGASPNNYPAISDPTIEQRILPRVPHVRMSSIERVWV